MDYTRRIQALQERLAVEKVDAFLVEQPSSLLYFTGLALSLGRLWVTPTQAILCVDGRYYQAAASLGHLSVEKLSEDAEKKALEKARIIAFDIDTLPYHTFASLTALLGRELIPKKGYISDIRRCKSAEEIALLKKAALLGVATYRYILRHLKPGISEEEVAAKLKIYALKKGAKGMSFEPIVAFGPNTALPHHRPGDRLLCENDTVLLDLGVILGGYCSDMTRVVFIGNPDPYVQWLYDITKRAQQAALALCKPGRLLKELDDAARSVMREEGVESYFTHSLGHGLGIDIHESPRIGQGEESLIPLQEGMVVTIEPGLYVPGKGGVRYEDTIAITQRGYRCLTVAK